MSRNPVVLDTVTNTITVRLASTSITTKDPTEIEQLSNALGEAINNSHFDTRTRGDSPMPGVDIWRDNDVITATANGTTTSLTKAEAQEITEHLDRFKLDLERVLQQS